MTRVVKRAFRKGAALLHEQAITETMLAPMALRISTWPNIVRIGTMKMPLAIPSMPPKALVPTDTANTHSSVSAFICGNRLSAGLGSAVRVGSRTCLCPGGFLLNLAGPNFESLREWSFG